MLNNAFKGEVFIYKKKSTRLRTMKLLMMFITALLLAKEYFCHVCFTIELGRSVHFTDTQKMKKD